MDAVLAIDAVGELGMAFLPDVLDALRVLLFAIVWLLVNKLAKLAMCIL